MCRVMIWKAIEVHKIEHDRRSGGHFEQAVSCGALMLFDFEFEQHPAVREVLIVGVSVLLKDSREVAWSVRYRTPFRV